MKKSDKEHNVAELREKFSRARAVVFTEYKGMTVADISKLRVSLRQSNLEYRVVKNTLAKIAMEGTPIEAAKGVMTGPIAVAIGYDDASLTAKKMFEFSKGKEKIKILSGCVEGRLFDPKELKAIGDLPPREVLLSQVAGCLAAPMSKMASLLSATIGGFVNAMNALKEKRSDTVEAPQTVET
ncbi:MAG: 50S ribosomal protein L10 [Nitrospirae bacterium]|nr:50S ribosomal protein L10 [Nitrospirota bacterium]